MVPLALALSLSPWPEYWKNVSNLVFEVVDMTQLTECLPTSHSSGLDPHDSIIGMLVHTCNPNTWEAQARPGVQGQPQLSAVCVNLLRSTPGSEAVGMW